MNAAGAGRRRWQWVGATLLLLLALHSVRVAVVEARGEQQPALARTLWPSHPRAIFDTGLAQIGEAARRARAPEESSLRLIADGAKHAPLATEPLLVAGTARLAQGRIVEAERLLLAAVRRDARAPGPRFLLADLYLRQQRMADAVPHLSALDRRLGGRASASFAPALARHLMAGGDAKALVPVLADEPRMRETLLRELVSANASTNLLIAFAQPGDASETSWLPRAIEQALGRGEIEAARRLHRASGGRTDPSRIADWLLMSPAAGPFAWRYPNTVGMAEPADGGLLRLVHFGREDGVLAEQLLLLAPGRYRLRQRLGPASVEQGRLAWRLSCASAQQALLLDAPLAPGGGEKLLVVPADCPAQRLQLFVRAGEVQTSVNAELSAVSLDPVGAGR